MRPVGSTTKQTVWKKCVILSIRTSCNMLHDHNSQLQLEYFCWKMKLNMPSTELETDPVSDREDLRRGSLWRAEAQTKLLGDLNLHLLRIVPRAHLQHQLNLVRLQVVFLLLPLPLPLLRFRRLSYHPLLHLVLLLRPPPLPLHLLLPRPPQLPQRLFLLRPPPLPLLLLRSPPLDCPRLPRFPILCPNPDRRRRGRRRRHLCFDRNRRRRPGRHRVEPTGYRRGLLPLIVVRLMMMNPTNTPTGTGTAFARGRRGRR